MTDKDFVSAGVLARREHAEAANAKRALCYGLRTNGDAVALLVDPDGVLQAAVENKDGGALSVSVSGNVEIVTSGNNVINARRATATRTDSFTGAGNGTSLNLTSNMALYHSVQVRGVGAAATAWDVRLEITNDTSGTWLEIASHATGDGDGVLKFPATSAARPALFMRARCASLTLGSATSISVVIAGA